MSRVQRKTVYYRHKAFPATKAPTKTPNFEKSASQHLLKKTITSNFKSLKQLVFLKNIEQYIKRKHWSKNYKLKNINTFVSQKILRKGKRLSSGQLKRYPLLLITSGNFEISGRTQEESGDPRIKQDIKSAVKRVLTNTQSENKLKPKLSRRKTIGPGMIQFKGLKRFASKISGSPSQVSRLFRGGFQLGVSDLDSVNLLIQKVPENSILNTQAVLRHNLVIQAAQDCKLLLFDYDKVLEFMLELDEQKEKIELLSQIFYYDSWGEFAYHTTGFRRLEVKSTTRLVVQGSRFRDCLFLVKSGSVKVSKWISMKEVQENPKREYFEHEETLSQFVVYCKKINTQLRKQFEVGVCGRGTVVGLEDFELEVPIVDKEGPEGGKDKNGIRSLIESEDEEVEESSRGFGGKRQKKRPKKAERGSKRIKKESLGAESSTKTKFWSQKTKKMTKNEGDQNGVSSKGNDKNKLKSKTKAAKMHYEFEIEVLDTPCVIYSLNATQTKTRYPNSYRVFEETSKQRHAEWKTVFENRLKLWLREFTEFRFDYKMRGYLTTHQRKELAQVQNETLRELEGTHLLNRGIRPIKTNKTSQNWQPPKRVTLEDLSLLGKPLRRVKQELEPSCARSIGLGCSDRFKRSSSRLKTMLEKLKSSSDRNSKKKVMKFIWGSVDWESGGDPHSCFVLDNKKNKKTKKFVVKKFGGGRARSSCQGKKRRVLGTGSERSAGKRLLESSDLVKSGKSASSRPRPPLIKQHYFQGYTPGRVKKRTVLGASNNSRELSAFRISSEAKKELLFSVSSEAVNLNLVDFRKAAGSGKISTGIMTTSPSLRKIESLQPRLRANKSPRDPGVNQSGDFGKISRAGVGRESSEARMDPALKMRLKEFSPLSHYRNNPMYKLKAKRRKDRGQMAALRYQTDGNANSGGMTGTAISSFEINDLVNEAEMRRSGGKRSAVVRRGKVGGGGSKSRQLI